MRLTALVSAFVIASISFLFTPMEAMAMPVPQAAPGGMSAGAEAELLRIFDSAAKGINEDLAAALLKLSANSADRGAAFRAGRNAELLNAIQNRVRRASAQTNAVVLPAMRSSWALGLRQAVAQMRSLGIDADARKVGLRQSFGGVNIEAVERIAVDTTARMTRSLLTYGDQAQTLFRSLGSGAFEGTAFGGAEGARAGEVAINRAIADGLVKGSPRAIERGVREVFRDPNSDAAKTFRQLGNKQVTVGGWTGPLRVYSRMLAHTRTREATEHGRHERLAANSITLVQITGRESVNFCSRFLGLVCALDDASTDGGRYPLLANMPSGGPPFHPNCTKSTAAFIVELVSKDRIAAHAKALEKYTRAKANNTLLKRLAA